MENNKANTVLLVVISIATLLTAVVGATFAFFTAQLSGVETQDSVIIKAGTLGTVFEGGAQVNINNIYPRNDHVFGTKQFTITATTSAVGAKIKYKISLAVDSNTFNNGSLYYTLRRDESSNGVMMPLINEPAKVPISNVVGSYLIGEGNFVGPIENEAHTYYVDFRYPDTDVVQNAEQESAFTGHIDIEVQDSSQGGT